MPTKVITYKDELYNVTLTVRNATVLDGMTRSVLLAQMFAQPLEETVSPELARFRRVLLLHTYPACLAATGFKNRKATRTITAEITPEEFFQLPETLVKEWETAVFEINSHWNPIRASDEEETEGEAKEPSDLKS